MRISRLIIIAFIIDILGCSPRTIPYSAQVEFLYKHEHGTIGLNSTGYGKNRVHAIEDAQKNALNILIFKGVPGSEMNLPLVQNESETRSKYSEYFKTFFDRQYYKMYVVSSTESSALVKSGRLKKISVDVKINYVSLRKELEQNNIIRKFGY